MHSGVGLNVVVRYAPVVVESLAREDETLLAVGDGFLLLNLVLQLANGFGWLEVDSDGPADEVLNEDLHVKEGSNQLYSL